MSTKLGRARSEFFKRKIVQRTPEELVEQIHRANLHEGSDAYQRGVAETCQWMLGMRTPPLMEKK